MQGLRHRYSFLYDEFVQTPELAKFRQFLDISSWRLNRQVLLIENKVKECNDAIADIEGISRETSVFRVTDFHPAHDVEQHPKLKLLIKDLDILVRGYSKDLILTHQVANLPEQNLVYARHFAEFKGLFMDGFYGPTGEAAARYQKVPADEELCALKGLDEEDYITNFLLKHAKSIYRSMYAVLGWLFRWPPLDDSSPTKYISLQAVRTSMHYFVGFYVPLLLTGTLALLNGLDSDPKRIIALGCVAFVLMWSLILLVPSLKRHDLVAIATAFFAVGGIYIGSRSHDSC